MRVINIRLHDPLTNPLKMVHYIDCDASRYRASEITHQKALIVATQVQDIVVIESHDIGVLEVVLTEVLINGVC